MAPSRTRDNTQNKAKSIYLSWLVEEEVSQMRLKMVRRLVDVNIIYATQPAQLAKFRKKQERIH